MVEMMISKVMPSRNAQLPSAQITSARPHPKVALSEAPRLERICFRGWASGGRTIGYEIYDTCARTYNNAADLI